MRLQALTSILVKQLMHPAPGWEIEIPETSTDVGNVKSPKRQIHFIAQRNEGHMPMHAYFSFLSHSKNHHY